MTQPPVFTFEPFFGGFVLETLTVGMYGESRNAIREYIQNAFDSIQKATKLGIISQEDGLIEIELSAGQDSLVIRDNGAGIPVKQAASTLTSVGASTKDPKVSAGFRGIGRLAGVGFCNKVTFKTKARGESSETSVTFLGNRMRELMSPSKGGEISAESLLRECITGAVTPSSDVADHYFEVTLEGFVDAPEECTNFDLLEEFVSQVAPVGYHPDFPYKQKLVEESLKCGLPIEEIRLTIKDGDRAPVDITKRYKRKYRIDSGDIELSECKTYTSPDGNWWAWVGKKNESGSYTDTRLSGLRVRMKNIQIDGTDVIREILKRRAKSSIRFQEWAVGEVFIRPSYLVPNARRDGFEETPAWREMRKELTDIIVEELGRDSYEISNAGQMSLSTLKIKANDATEELERLRKSGFKNQDKTLELSVGVTKLQKRIASASKNANLTTLAELQAISSELIDIKTEAVSGIRQATPIDLDSVQQEAKDELLQQLIVLFEEELQSPCFVAVRNLLREHYGVSG